MKKKMIIISTISFLMVVLISFTFGKYIASGVWNYYLKAKGFYFTSDNLGETSVSNVNNLWDGESVEFNIKNYLNNEVAAGYDIAYDIVCTIEGEAASYSECHLNGTTSSTASGTLSYSQYCSNVKGDSVDVSSYDEETCINGGYIWKNATTIANPYFDVILTNQNYEIKDVIVNINVTSTSPYTKTLLGKFSLHKVETDLGSIIMDYNTYDKYDRLIITNTNDSNKCLSLTWNAEDLLIDTDDYIYSNTDTNGYINNIKFMLTGKNSTSYMFYKTNSASNFDETDFVIVESTGC